MQKRIITIFHAILFFPIVSFAQKNNIGNNYVVLNDTDSYHTIIEKAANVAPSKRQLI